jgi:hypothetical protein
LPRRDRGSPLDGRVHHGARLLSLDRVNHRPSGVTEGVFGYAGAEARTPR